jgi:aminomethyltransferase
MGYLPTALANPDAQVFADVRGQRLPLRVVTTPFVRNTYKR